MYRNNEERIKIFNIIFDELKKLDFPGNDLQLLEDHRSNIEIVVRNNKM